MKCHVCGEEVGNAKVCPVCGATIKVPEVKPQPVQAAPAKPAAPVSRDEQAHETKKDPQSILEEIEQAKISMIEKTAKSVVKITRKLDEGTYSGTGWVASERLIVTNSHVIGDRGDDQRYPIYVEFTNKLDLGNRQKIRMKLIFYSELEDIAILTPYDRQRIPEEVPILPIATGDCKQGELVFTIGNPLHYKFTYTEGAVANPNYPNQFGGIFNILQTTLTLNSGNSGGPVFNCKGEVVGMATFSELRNDNNNHLTEIAGYGFCVKNDGIIAVLSRIN